MNISTYGDGRSEKFLSKIIKSTSEKIYVSTKLGRRVGVHIYQKGYKHEPMEEFIDRSLINLGVEVLIFCNYIVHHRNHCKKRNL